MKTIEEKFAEIFEIGMTYYCTDDPELKKLALSINSEVSEEGRKLHEESIIIDMCTFYLEDYNWQLEQAGATALNCTVPDVIDGRGEALRQIMNYYEAVKRSPDKLMILEKAEDLITAKKEGKTGIIIGAQSCDFVMHSDLEASTEAFARLGLRVMQIAYNGRSFAADGCLTECDAGLSVAGKALIRAMEKAGITVDLSHVGRRSTLDAMDVCTKPPIFSHSNPIKMFNHPRNITDEQAKKCAALGGVIGVVAFPPLLWDGKTLPSIDRFIDTVAYYADLVGIDHVGIGLDTNAQPGAYNRNNYRNMMKMMENQKLPLPNVYLSAYNAGQAKTSMFTKGIVSLANLMNITDHLLKRGFSKEDTKKVMGENFFRVFKETWRR
jgi:membrane dipeptidase